MQANLRMFKKLSAIDALDSSTFLLPSHTRSGLATKWVLCGSALLGFPHFSPQTD